MQVSAFQSLRALRLFRSPRFWLVVLLLSAWALRLYHLDTMSLWWDESLSWDRAANSLQAVLSNTIQIQNVTTRDLHPPLYFVFLHFVVLVAGATEFALRFLSVGANLLTLAMFVPLAKVLFGKRGAAVGLLAVLFGAVSPFYVWYAQEARPYALVLLTSVLCIYALLRWLATNPHGWHDFRSRWFLVFVLTFGASFATLYLSFVLLPFFAAAVLLLDPRRGWERWRSPRTAFAAALGLAFVVLLFLMPRETDMTSWDQAGPRFVPLFIMLRDVWNSFSVGLSLTLDQATLFDWYLLALWLAGIFSLVRVTPRTVRLALFLFGYLLIPALALQLGSYLRPLYLNSRHLITTSPAFYLGLAVGVYALASKLRMTFDASRFFERSKGKRRASAWLAGVVGLLAAGVVVAGAGYSLNNLYFDETYAKDDHKAWAQFLRERLRRDDYLFLVAPQAEKLVRYYLPDGVQWESLPHLGQTRDWQEFLDRQAILEAYRTYPRVWLMELHQPVADPTLHITDLLNRWGRPTESMIFRGISTEIRLQAFVYSRMPQTPAQELPAGQRIFFTHNFELVAFDPPSEIEAGSRGVINLYWRTRRPYTDEINVSVRVVDENGKVWGQWDAPPVGNLFPLSKWKADETYLDQHDLVVDAGAPPGKYFVEVSVYSTRDNTRWLAYRGGEKSDQPLRLAEITVTRPKEPRDPRTLVFDAHTDVPFGNTVRFVGYDLEERTTNPGSEIPVTLYFQLLEQPAQNVQGAVTFAAPWWQLWNPTRSSTPFTLDLAGRYKGDIVQTRVNLRVPGEASPGGYDLRLALDGLNAQTLVPSNAYTFGTISVDALARSTDLPPISRPYRGRFADKVEFLGYDLNAPDPLKPDDRVRLTLYWRALQPMDISYTVFTHLVNAENKIYGQRDQAPLEGARPTTSWAAGEIFTDVYEFNVAADAPPGAYKLKIGFYNPSDFTRLPTFDANGSPLGDSILFEDLRVQ